MRYKLGKKPARPGSIALRAGHYLVPAQLPKVPEHFGHPWLVRQWGMLGNDQYGDCVWAGFAHETVMLCADARNLVPTFTSKTVLADYASTGFNPHDPSTDTGTDIATAAAYRRKTGIIDILGARHQIDVYAALRRGDLEELALTTFLFGATGVGVQLPDSAMDQFDSMEPWSLVKGATTIGGHYIPCVGRNSLGQYLFVTWGRLQAAEPAWVREYMDEGLCYISRERLKRTGVSPQGYNLEALDSDFAAAIA